MSAEKIGKKPIYNPKSGEKPQQSTSIYNPRTDRHLSINTFAFMSAACRMSQADYFWSLHMAKMKEFGVVDASGELNFDAVDKLVTNIEYNYEHRDRKKQTAADKWDNDTFNDFIDWIEWYAGENNEKAAQFIKKWREAHKMSTEAA